MKIHHFFSSGQEITHKFQGVTENDEPFAILLEENKHISLLSVKRNPENLGSNLVFSIFYPENKIGKTKHGTVRNLPIAGDWLDIPYVIDRKNERIFLRRFIVESGRITGFQIKTLGFNDKEGDLIINELSCASYSESEIANYLSVEGGKNKKEEKHYQSLPKESLLTFQSIIGLIDGNDSPDLVLTRKFSAYKSLVLLNFFERGKGKKCSPQQ